MTGSLDGSKIGRLGEDVAFRYLMDMCSRLPDPPRVIWNNKDCEKLEPFDILIEHADGRIQKCEVKTRWKKQSARSSRQWFISLREIQYALLKGKDYFCILIELQEQISDDTSRSAVPMRMDFFLVGYDTGGLCAALTEDKDLGLVIQMN